MNQFFEKYPWLRTMLCGLMAAALLLSVLLPVLRLQRQEPENPIREENIQPVEPLSFGEAEGGTRLSAPEQTEDGPGGGQTQPENAEQPTAPEETDPIQDPQPAQPQEDPNQQQPGNEVPSDGMGETQPGEDGTEADDGALDLGLVLSWKRYGSERYRSLCPANRTVRQDVRTAQIPDGQFGYELELQGLDAGSAEIIAVQIAENGGNAVPADIRGGIAMRLGSDGADSYYTLQVQASVTRVLEDGSRREELVTFAFLLVYSDSLDLEAEFQWLCADGKMDRMLCQPGRQISAALHEEDIPENLLQYQFRLRGESAGDAAILSAEYRAEDGTGGTLETTGGTWMLQAASDGKNVYTITLLVEVTRGGQTRQLTFTFRLSWQEVQEVTLNLTWIKNSTEAQTLSCEPDGQVSAEIRRTELRQGELQYRLGLDGKNAAQASLVSAGIQPEGGAMQELALPNGSTTLTIPDGAAAIRYVLTVQARCQRSDGTLRNMTFTYVLRYSGGVGLEMQYTLLDGTVKMVRCANGQSKTAETVYSDELEDGVLPFTMTLTGGEDADGVQITKVTCFQSGNNRMTTLPTDGAVTIPLLVHSDGSEGENQFKVTAQAAGGETYTFTVNVPYKLRGDGIVKIETSLDEETKVLNGTKITMTMQAWSEKKDDGTLIARMTASDTVVTLDGETLRCDGTVGGRLQYTMIPENPETGDENEHILRIGCEDAYGNRGEKTLTLRGERTRKGQPAGWASIYIDMTVLGLGTTSAIRYEVLSGETASYAVAKAVWGEDAGEPFGTAVESFGWPASEKSYSGSFDLAFYLEKLGDGTDMAARSNALRNSWENYQISPSNSKEENLAKIDAVFGETSPYAALWRSIYLAGLTLNPCHQYSIGQFDYTPASGWLYSIGGGTNYPLKYLSDYELRDGDVLVLRYTLAGGRDVGDAGAAGSKDTAAGNAFCVTAINGSLTVAHQWTTVVNEDGTEQKVCASCGKIEACDHPTEKLEYRLSEDETKCYEFCLKCGKPVTEAEEHKWTVESIEENAEQHRKICKNCKHEVLEDHRFKFIEDTATCEQAGQTVQRCIQCEYEKRTPSQATGHRPSKRADAKEHWEECEIESCQKEIEGSRAAHSYQWDAGWNDWTCTGCGFSHSGVCTGTPESDESASTCSHEELHCSVCGAEFRRDAQGAFAYPHSYVVSSEECTCSREVRVCSVCGARDVTEQIGAFANRYPHHYENGECIYCHAHEEGPTDPGPTLEPEPEPTPSTDPEPNLGETPEYTEE